MMERGMMWSKDRILYTFNSCIIFIICVMKLHSECRLICGGEGGVNLFCSVISRPHPALLFGRAKLGDWES